MLKSVYKGRSDIRVDHELHKVSFTMVYPLMRMDGDRRRKYATLASFSHFICALCMLCFALHLSTVNFFLLKGISQIMSHRTIASYIPCMINALEYIIGFIHIWAVIAFANQRNSATRWHANSIKEAIFLLVMSLACMLFVIGTAIFYQSNFIVYLAHGLFRAMENYTNTTTDKMYMDWLQAYFQCCGINRYKDWTSLNPIKDIELYGAERKLKLQPHKWAYCSSNGCYVPHSCCIPEAITCSPRILMRNLTENVEAGENRAKQWFYPVGCLEAVSQTSFPAIMTASSIVNICLQIIALIYSQVAATSYFMLEICEAEEETALPAWIIPYGFPLRSDIIAICRKRIKDGDVYTGTEFFKGENVIFHKPQQKAGMIVRLKEMALKMKEGLLKLFRSKVFRKS
ncbi:hypothetical protein AB6A40_000387 [Gnathostoma spinigerum]|uniref:Tetraspanin n=1 Tax=Gnathostoma spinigerum TaxID=75299 RepID=A0ABD6EAB5_9BILA